MMKNNAIMLIKVLLISAVFCLKIYSLSLPPGEEEWIRYSQARACEEHFDKTIPACKAFHDHCAKKPTYDVIALQEWEFKNYELYEQCMHESIEQSIKNLQEQAQKHSEM